MASFFTFCQDSLGFFKKSTVSSPSKVLYSGKLSAAQDDSRLPEAIYLLTKTTLYQCSDDPENPVCKLEADIRWSVMLPFEEDNGTETSYGFSLTYKKSKMDFYTQSSEDLKAWVDHLEEICILQDISEDFTIKKQIGSGGQSVVMLAEFLATGEEVAVKCFLKEKLAGSVKKIKALVNEIEVLRNIKHPNILELYRVYEDQKTIFLVTEYIEGEDLFQSLVTKGRLTPEEGRKFVEKFLNLLDYFNKLKILHRDLKPENIMIMNPTDRSDFKLIDFGFAIKYSEVEISGSCGSPGYTAPEILTGHRHGSTVDIYSAGILFYVVLAGYSPFFSSDKKDVIKKNALGQIEFGKKWNTIDPKFARVISVMTSLIPEQRTSVEELRALMSTSQTLTLPIPTRRGSFSESLASEVPIFLPITQMTIRPSQASLVQKRLQSMCE